MLARIKMTIDPEAESHHELELKEDDGIVEVPSDMSQNEREQVLVAWAVKSQYRLDDGSYPTASEIAEKTRLGPDAVEKALEFLEQAGLITTVKTWKYGRRPETTLNGLTEKIAKTLGD
jgi:hypothetical protein